MNDELYETAQKITQPIVVKSKFKPIPVLEATREYLLNNMKKKDTYDSFINKVMDIYLKHKDEIEGEDK